VSDGKRRITNVEQYTVVYGGLTLVDDVRGMVYHWRNPTGRKEDSQAEFAGEHDYAASGSCPICQPADPDCGPDPDEAGRELTPAERAAMEQSWEEERVPRDDRE
jgi:hypothetical protein